MHTGVILLRSSYWGHSRVCIQQYVFNSMHSTDFILQHWLFMDKGSNSDAFMFCGMKFVEGKIEYGNLAFVDHDFVE